MFKQKPYGALILIVLFSASCAHSNKKSLHSAQKRSAGSASMELKSPLSNEDKLIQELTGKAVSKIPTQAQLKNKPLSTQHYFAGMRAAEAHNYIVAIKHFNTVLKNYPRSAEVKKAFAAKGKVYLEMGLKEPASLNLKMAGRNIKPLPMAASNAPVVIRQKGQAQNQSASPGTAKK